MVISGMQKEKERRKREYMGAGSAVLSGRLREGLVVKVTFDQQGESCDGKSRAGICMKNVPGREVTSLKSARREQPGKEVGGSPRGVGLLRVADTSLPVRRQPHTSRRRAWLGLGWQQLRWGGLAGFWVHFGGRVGRTS